MKLTISVSRSTTTVPPPLKRLTTAKPEALTSGRSSMISGFLPAEKREGVSALELCVAVR
jgi:hypothetical protein